MLHIVAVNQIIAPDIADISLIQFLFIITAPDQVETRIVRIVINAIVAEGRKNAPVNGIPESNLVRNVVITQFIDIPAVHTVGSRCQSQQESGPEVTDDPPVLVRYGVVKFIHYDVIEIVGSKILFSQVFRLAQRRNRGKDK